eukprot:352576-Chlamydomonas_euryale.AAC.3
MVDMSGMQAFTRDMRDCTPAPHFVPYHAVPQVTQIIPLRAMGPAGLPALGTVCATPSTQHAQHSTATTALIGRRASAFANACTLLRASVISFVELARTEGVDGGSGTHVLKVATAARAASVQHEPADIA